MKQRHRGISRIGAVAVLLLSACATVDESDQAPSEEVAQSMTDEASAEGSSLCNEPPSLPSDVPTFGSADAPAEADADLLNAVLHTTCGDIGLELYGDLAPVTVGSFDFLAQEGYWANSPCHRLTTEGIYVLQCGDPTGTGRGGPGYTFGIENVPPDGNYPRGTLAMARAQDPNSNGGQFFIVYRDTTLPVDGGGYTAFGKVTSGMDIIDQIAEEGVDGGAADGGPAQPISILEVEITEEKASDS